MIVDKKYNSAVFCIEEPCYLLHLICTPVAMAAVRLWILNVSICLPIEFIWSCQFRTVIRWHRIFTVRTPVKFFLRCAKAKLSENRKRYRSIRWEMWRSALRRKESSWTVLIALNSSCSCLSPISVRLSWPCLLEMITRAVFRFALVVGA